MRLPVNLNDTVAVTLTDDGLGHLQQYCEKLGTKFPPPWLHGRNLHTQLWDLMHIFGPKMYTGFTSQVFENNIIQIEMGAD